jgi:hypothetical protein
MHILAQKLDVQAKTRPYSLQLDLNGLYSTQMRAGGDGYTLYGSYQNTWTDVGKFLTGFTAVAAIAIPSVLAHAKVGPKAEDKCQGVSSISYLNFNTTCKSRESQFHEVGKSCTKC